MNRDYNFDWETDEAVVFKTGQGMAIYEDASGNIVMRQEKDAHSDDDSSISFPRDRLSSVVGALQGLLMRQGVSPSKRP